MDIYHDEFLKLMGCLHNCGVKYMLVGGFATNFYGYHRTTADIDIWIKDDPQNRKSLIRALSDMGYGNLSALESAALLPGYCEVILDSGMYMDIMDQIMGFEQEKFTECFNLAVEVEVQKVPIRYLHYNTLIQSKKSSSTLKDQLDVQELERINKIKN